MILIVFGVIFITVKLQNSPNVARIFVAGQGSADAACQEGTQGADAGLLQKDRHLGTVL